MVKPIARGLVWYWWCCRPCHWRHLFPPLGTFVAPFVVVKVTCASSLGVILYALVIVVKSIWYSCSKYGWENALGWALRHKPRKVDGKGKLDHINVRLLKWWFNIKIERSSSSHVPRILRGIARPRCSCSTNSTLHCVTKKKTLDNVTSVYMSSFVRWPRVWIQSNANQNISSTQNNWQICLLIEQN